jgi:hypothetical protein
MTPTKKNVLSLRIGLPTVPPDVKSGFSSPSKKFRASSVVAVVLADAARSRCRLTW